MISKFEMSWIKAEDFMSAWSWAILMLQINGQGTGPSSLRMWRHVGAKHKIVVAIEGFQMRREMSSDSEGSYISEISDSDHEERKGEEEESSVRIAMSVCGTNTCDVTDKVTWYFDRAIRITFFGTKWLNFKHS